MKANWIIIVIIIGTCIEIIYTYKVIKMFCPKCGTENSDANYCEKCGEKLTKSRFPLAVIAILLIALVVLGGLYAFNTRSEVSLAANNTTSNNTTVKYTKENQSSAIETKLIDSGEITGFDDVYYNSSYVSSWKTYATGKDDVKINVKWNFKDVKKSFTQKITIEKIRNTPPEVRITVIPKASGRSSYETFTSATANGYKNVVDYYWNFYRDVLFVDPSNRH